MAKEKSELKILADKASELWKNRTIKNLNELRDFYEGRITEEDLINRNQSSKECHD